MTEPKRYPEEQLRAAVSRVAELTSGMRCPCCNHTGWYIEQSSPGLGLLIPPTPVPGYILTELESFWEGPPAIAALILSCQTCGFVRHHNLPVLLQSIDQGEADG